MDVTYEMIAPNVADVKVTGTTVEVAWKCPASGASAGTSSAGMSADDSIGATVGATVKHGVIREIMYAVTNLIGGLIGGAGGRVVREAAYTASSHAQQKVASISRYTEESRHAAIVAAWRSIENRFRWDEAKKQFVKSDH